MILAYRWELSVKHSSSFTIVEEPSFIDNNEFIDDDSDIDEFNKDSKKKR